MSDKDVNWAQVLAEVVDTAGLTPEALAKILAAVERAGTKHEFTRHLGELRLVRLGQRGATKTPISPIAIGAPAAVNDKPDAPAAPASPVTATRDNPEKRPHAAAPKSRAGGARPGCNGWVGRATCKLCGRTDVPYRIVENEAYLRGHRDKPGGRKCEGLFPKAGSCRPYE